MTASTSDLGQVPERTGQGIDRHTGCMAQRHESTLEHLLGSRVRARLVASLVVDGGHRPYLRELIRDAGPGVRFVKHEVAELERLRIIRSDRRGAGIFFETDTSHPLYEPLRDLVRAASWIDGDGSLRPLEWVMRYESGADELLRPRIRKSRHAHPL